MAVPGFDLMAWRNRVAAMNRISLGTKQLNIDVNKARTNSLADVIGEEAELPPPSPSKPAADTRALLRQALLTGEKEGIVRARRGSIHGPGRARASSLSATAMTPAARALAARAAVQVVPVSLSDTDADAATGQHNSQDAENRVMAMIEARKKGGKQIGQDFIERKAKETGHIQRRLSFSGFSRVPPGYTVLDAVHRLGHN
jgi:hypothetical protein